MSILFCQPLPNLSPRFRDKKSSFEIGATQSSRQFIAIVNGNEREKDENVCSCEFRLDIKSRDGDVNMMIAGSQFA